MKKMTKAKMWQFAIGQLGWSLLSALITNWLVYFYQPDADAIAQGQTVFIPQGLVVLGIATVIGAIAAVGRVFDAITDPLIANLSDRSTNPRGRRIPFMQKIAVPFAVITVLVFWSPVNGTSNLNALWLLVTLLLFYLFMTTYCTPFNALIPELGRTQEDRINISTYISVTYFIGSALAYAGPYLWGALTPSLGRVGAIRVTFIVLSALALICLLVPTFTIREKDYASTKPAEGDAFTSLVKTFRNREFCKFVGSDVLYWIALTIFQTGLPFFITSLLQLPETMTTILYLAMTILSFLCYVPVNLLAKKTSKRRLVLIGFVWLTVVYAVTAAAGLIGVSGMVYGGLIVLLAAFPMAILGILPQAIVADIAQSDAVLTGENREGMFYAARTFAFKLGQSVAMLLFTALASVGTGGAGYRLAAAVAAVLCLAGALVLSRYNEGKVLGTIESRQ
ncbi:MAG: MFS transporter [Eubacteriales bacterium]|nr:MFS transporter [Eubacteriales bacterium]